MPLDPQAQALLDQMAAAGAPPLDTLSPADARAATAGFKDLGGPPEEVAKVEDRTVPGPAGAIPVRVYTPSGSGPFPALVYYHGGGWVIGDLEVVDPVCRSLTNAANCVVVSVDYRLAPEHKFPAAADDCYAATKSVVEHAAEFGIDPARVAIGGDSAGGNLAAVVALMARDQGGPRIVHQLLVYPVTDHSYETVSYRDNADGYLLTKASMKYFWDHYLRGPDDSINPLASPLRAPSLANLPPAFVMTAEFDPLRDEGEAYAKRLQAAGVPVESKRYDGMVHGFFWMAGVLDQGRKGVHDAASALKAAWK